LKCHQVGAPKGRMVVYFHGAPGAPAESQLFDLAAKEQGLTVICLDRFAIDPAITGEVYYKLLADMTVDTQLWQGDEDNWSPPQMAHYLASAMAGHSSTTSFSGLSHYSCLYRAAPEICRVLGRA